MRGTTKQRGYSGAHQKLRAQWAPLVNAGLVNCHATNCLEPARHIVPGTPWHLGHTPDRTAWTGPEHQHCNIADGQHRAQARRATPPPRWITSRQW